MTKEQREALLNALYEIKCVCDSEYWLDDDCWEHCPLGGEGFCLVRNSAPTHWKIGDVDVVWKALS